MQTVHTTRQDERPANTDERGVPMAREIQPQPIIPEPCPPFQTLQHRSAGQRRRVRGFTLIELMLVVAVAGVLSGVAYPSFVGQMQKVRRADALVAMLQVQASQERWRANNVSYGSLAQIGVAAVSLAGHYTLQETSSDETGYAVQAVANGPQAQDAQCRILTLRADGANVTYASGPDVAVANAVALNRQCWSL